MTTTSQFGPAAPRARPCTEFALGEVYGLPTGWSGAGAKMQSNHENQHEQINDRTRSTADESEPPGHSPRRRDNAELRWHLDGLAIDGDQTRPLRSREGQGPWNPNGRIPFAPHPGTLRPPRSNLATAMKRRDPGGRETGGIPKGASVTLFIRPEALVGLNWFMENHQRANRDKVLGTAIEALLELTLAEPRFITKIVSKLLRYARAEGFEDGHLQTELRRARLLQAYWGKKPQGLTHT